MTMTETLTETRTRTLKLVYFAWVRERIGLAEEKVELPAETRTIADLVRWLKTRGEGYEAAFDNEAIVRAAIDHSHVKPDAVIADASEIAFFPPMTGG
ncbi:molybdopterin synthase sulfur carrier subunit [Bosea sp. BK604]|nr:molybdopterin synthase sulfur carrier subunit [Bosea sp. BK604]